MAKLHGLQADYVFRGVEHIVRMTVEGSLLEVEVEDRLTTDQWRGEFDAAFIEDLTHKTGNFKQFGIFCSMLESALTQSSESVTLDLLTYTDLESLRNQKIGVGPRHMSAAKASPLNSKRYLILIYSVEFDRIHYPLPLPYVGKPDPVVLQRVIRELKEELATLKAKPGKDFRDAEIRRLRDELQQALEEKQAAETALLGLQEELKLTNKSSAFKEVKILKKVVQSLEEELTKERAKHQRVASKRLQESRQLVDELAELKATERSLRIRVKNLTNELALYKKGRFTPAATSPQSHSARSFGPPALTRAGTKMREDRRSVSRERSNSRERSGAWGPSRQRSTSREGRGAGQGRLARQSPSPTGIRASRFDPTAFVKAKERKQKEAEQKNKRCLRRGTGDTPPSGWHPAPSRGLSAFGTGGFGKARGRSSSVESFRSRHSTASSGSEMDDYSEPAAPRSRKRMTRGRKPLSSSSWNGSAAVPQAGSGHRKCLASTPTAGKRADKENLYDEPSADLSEIDARLQALQEYMNKLETRT
ncbi:centrosomal protein CCDC61 [Hemicordylus capensis]|uniref:centrosomal protein CCDC61 n=1 Tax=Hemicordylus capensis TaxID=884348 RepID=UPI0023032CEB|nr:centrosomal protein CCDC61 [Hemicordylus capensis]XP_053124858.1 centrosomal protein CCDC61 [Hemicordylus capensis]